LTSDSSVLDDITLLCDVVFHIARFDRGVKLYDGCSGASLRDISNEDPNERSQKCPANKTSLISRAR
jgi:hypothetical protein